MRILSVHTGFGPGAGGGAERSYAMARHLLDAGEDVRLLMTDRYLVNGEAPPGYPFPAERMSVLRHLNDRYDVPLLHPRTIRTAVRDADVIHILGHVSPIAPAVCAAARRRRTPWVVCVAGMLPFRGRSMALKRAVHSVWGRRILRDAARVIAITPDEQRLLADHARSPDRVVLVPNATDVPPTVAHAAFESQPYLLFLGGFHPTKGADLLVEAFARARLDDHVLVMAGGYEANRGAIEALARRLGVRDRIRFAGWLSGEAKASALAGASFVVIPSRLDAMTIVVLEAAAAGTPVLITNGCGFPDVEDEGGGLVVEPTIEALAAGLRRMTDSRERWPQMSDAMALLARRYSWPAMTERYVRLFREVVAEARV